MVTSFFPPLKEIGNHCTYCYLKSEKIDVGERLHEKNLVQEGLTKLLSFTKEPDKMKIILKALQTCKNCNYSDPNVFYFLQDNGIRF